MKDRQIEHRGVIESVMQQCVIVSIAQETACSTCVAAQLCHSSDKREKHMEIPCNNASSYRVGQEVTIVGKLGLGLRATFFAYVIPVVLLMTVLIAVARLTGNEGWGAVAALGSLIPYYIILYIFRNHMQRKFTFSIKEA